MGARQQPRTWPGRPIPMRSPPIRPGGSLRTSKQSRVHARRCLALEPSAWLHDAGVQHAGGSICGLELTPPTIQQRAVVGVICETGAVARPKKQPTPGDMVRSLAVILVPILVITFIASRNLDGPPVQTVDWQPVLSQARTEAAFPVLAPADVPANWRARTVSWVKAGDADAGGTVSPRNEWQLGFLNPEDIYVAIAQGDAAQPELVKEKTRSGLPDGQSTVAGRTWERRVSGDERTRSLVMTTPAVASIVVGDTSYEALEAYASTLQAG